MVRDLSSRIKGEVRFLDEDVQGEPVYDATDLVVMGCRALADMEYLKGIFAKGQTVRKKSVFFRQTRLL